MRKRQRRSKTSADTFVLTVLPENCTQVEEEEEQEAEGKKTLQNAVGS